MWYTIKGLEIDKQATAVLEYLKGEHSVEDVPEKYVYCQTAAWYNCREGGISITVSSLAKEVLIVTFGEHRISDDIFVDTWLSDVAHLNPPTVEEFTDEAYANRKYFHYGEVRAAARYVAALIAAYIENIALAKQEVTE